MKTAETVQRLYREEMNKRKLNESFASLKRRRGPRFVENPYNEIPPEESAPIWNAWHEFHLTAGHCAYQDFYSKLSYCDQIKDKNVSEDVFFKLIADRSFLFLEQSESYTGKLSFPLSELVNAEEVYRKMFETNSEMQHEIDRVLEQGFVPTGGHKAAYREWLSNLEELKNAYRLRKIHINELPQKIEAFSIPISSAAEESVIEDVSDVKALSELFSAYMVACQETAYVRWKHYRYPGQGEAAGPIGKHYVSAICSVARYLENKKSNIPGFKALVYFHLFTQCAEKMCAGKWRKYNFAPLVPRKSVERNPSENHPRISRRIECNIMLYDYLLEMFLHEKPAEKKESQYRAEAKYIFYLFSRYDQYWHYDMNGFDRNQHNKFKFDASVDYKDGVDHFGGMLRYHIHFALSTHVEWLLPPLCHSAKSPLSTLTTFLLMEGMQDIPAKERLINRVKRYLCTEKGEDMVTEYSLYHLDEPRVAESLLKWSKQIQVQVKNQNRAIYEPEDSQQAIQKCPQYILEYALRERMVEIARNNLGNVAKRLFDSLCLESFSN